MTVWNMEHVVMPAPGKGRDITEVIFNVKLRTLEMTWATTAAMHTLQIKASGSGGLCQYGSSGKTALFCLPSGRPQRDILGRLTTGGTCFYIHSIFWISSHRPQCPLCIITLRCTMRHLTLFFRRILFHLKFIFDWENDFNSLYPLLSPTIPRVI